jgi:hypothetical protein
MWISQRRPVLFSDNYSFCTREGKDTDRQIDEQDNVDWVERAIIGWEYLQCCL